MAGGEGCLGRAIGELKLIFPVFSEVGDGISRYENMQDRGTLPLPAEAVWIM